MSNRRKIGLRHRLVGLVLFGLAFLGLFFASQFMAEYREWRDIQQNPVYDTLSESAAARSDYCLIFATLAVLQTAICVLTAFGYAYVEGRAAKRPPA